MKAAARRERLGVRLEREVRRERVIHTDARGDLAAIDACEDVTLSKRLRPAVIQRHYVLTRIFAELPARMDADLPLRPRVKKEISLQLCRPPTEFLTLRVDLHAPFRSRPLPTFELDRHSPA